jgi:tetratricopeptide (TPR) repeat protein
MIASRMDPERWRRVRAIVERALDLAPVERREVIVRDCAGDAALQAEVEALLERDAASGRVEPPSAAEVAATVMRAAPGDEGRRIGAWRLEREIGAGGMGTVWLARRAEGGFEQRAAIKLIQRGMATDLLLERFQRERRVLAALEHENIARLYDGGSTGDGRPYLVMEYVEGEPLDRYCAARSLGLRARLELFLAVCAAVQHAHQNLVVHRDIKPSNVLVTQAGVAKLLDFGIAKVLSPEGEEPGGLTVAAERMLTPLYASPEQLRGEPLTTQSDVFSLGLVLYELVAGRPAFDSGRRPDTEPPAPSRAARTARQRALSGLDRDLDTIVLAAIQPDLARRYASVEALAEDLRRYLGGLPVRARADSAVYRAAKFVRRNRVAVAAALAVIAALVAGLVATTVQYRRTLRAQKTADRRFAEVRGLATRFVYDVDSALSRVAGSTAARQMIADTASEYLDRLAAERAEDRELALDVVVAYTRVSEILYQPGAGSLGKPSQALATLDKALALARELAAADPASELVAVRFAQVLRPRATVLAALGRHAEAERDLERAIELTAAVRGEAKLAFLAASMQAEGPRLLAELRSTTGDHEGARAAAQDALAKAEAFVAAHPRLGLPHAELARAHAVLAQALEAGGDVEGALEHLRIAARSHATSRELDPEHAGYRRDLAVASFRLAQALGGASRWAEALAPAEDALRAFAEIAARDPRDGLALQDLAAAHSALQNALAALGREDEAFEHAERALELAERRAELDQNDLPAASVLAIASYRFGALLLERGDVEGGLARMRRARELFEHVARASPDDADAGINCAWALAGVGVELMQRAGSDPTLWREARDSLAAAVVRFRELASRGALAPDEATSLAEYESAIRECDAHLPGAAPSQALGGR